MEALPAHLVLGSEPVLAGARGRIGVAQVAQQPCPGHQQACGKPIGLRLRDVAARGVPADNVAEFVGDVPPQPMRRGGPAGIKKDHSAPAGDDRHGLAVPRQSRRTYDDAQEGRHEQGVDGRPGDSGTSEGFPCQELDLRPPPGLRVSSSLPGRLPPTR